MLPTFIGTKSDESMDKLLPDLMLLQVMKAFIDMLNNKLIKKEMKMYSYWCVLDWYIVHV